MDEQTYTNIAKGISGEATQKELNQLSEWLLADPKNQAEYEQLKRIWGQTDDILEAPRFETHAAWEKVSGKLGLEQQPARRSIILSPVVRYSLAAAAVLLIGVFIIGQLPGGKTVTVAATDKNMEILLPDNSQITLRKGSSLSYPKSFSGNERRVTLKGEAFFEVARNEQKPFIINAQSATVQVLGTSFDVRCNEEKATVVVKTGKVQMSDSKKVTSVILTPGEKGILKDGQLTEQQARIDNLLYWQTGMLKYSETPLVGIIEELSQVKDTTIVIDPSMPGEQKNQMITITFNGQNLEDILTDLCLIAQCQWSKNGDSYRVSSK